MTDGAITTIVSGAVTIATMVIGFLTLWVKLKYGVKKAEEAATKAQVVEGKIDANVALTKAGTAEAATHAEAAAKVAAEAKDAAAQAADRASVVERKLDENTATTNSVDAKTDTIVEQTNGVIEDTQKMIVALVARVEKLEEYNRTSAHRIFDAINAVHLKVAELHAAVTKVPPIDLGSK